jgi:hypothetical protein
MLVISLTLNILIGDHVTRAAQKLYTD